MQIKITPPDPNRNRPQIIDLPAEMTVRTLPRTPREEGGDKTKIKSVVKYSWVEGSPEAIAKKTLMTACTEVSIGQCNALSNNSENRSACIPKLAT